ncbi:hypothetical protein B0T26DRAFT_741712 [Lasiosphaeria miniovina]|uniref:Uncharacterized protein n=1 Tax=Lasiosphaeria miniovina TaxID=1954250 RepID=A0AA40ABB7_9PEZI|nr:uncharacterized protein B0T26DRAFT_741712 [Lasiosphaeria miniovina]KAK0712712.1 hypothetical protein B0T26DRAFT_741712 [Lasiosphaeria miniovina]
MSGPENVLIVGANRGIGFELATRFVKKGYNVWGTYRPQTRGDSSVSDLKGSGVHTIELDFTDEASINAAAQEYGNRPLGILVNCAGVYHQWDDKAFTELSAEDLMVHFKVNVVGPFLASKAFLPALERAGQGKIVNVSSDMASIADNTGGNACYRVSKAGVNQLTKTMAVDLAKLGSKVLALAVHPGFVATKMTGYFGKDDMDECMAALADVIVRFGTADGAAIPHGGYVRWNGDIMAY